MNDVKVEKTQLTEYSRGAGCGCKIAPSVLQEILLNVTSAKSFANLLVGNNSNDDAAVYEIENNRCLIATTDFFMPIVDDAFDFGRIAAVNALSDVYAMGGKPILALAILGWPIDKLSAVLASEVLRGARAVCEQENIPLAGGHTVDSAEPFFGLSVNGLVEKNNLKQNDTAKAGDLLYLTKPVGTGIITTAFKRKLIDKNVLQKAVDVMTQMNSVGETFGKLNYVHALTDVTGFGLIGHLYEMCSGSGISAELSYNDIPILGEARKLAKQYIYPDNTMRNWKSYESHVEGISGESLLTLCDPQTSGGLLVAVDSTHQVDFENFLEKMSLKDLAKPIGRMFAAKGEIKIVLT